MTPQELRMMFKMETGYYTTLIKDLQCQPVASIGEYIKWLENLILSMDDSCFDNKMLRKPNRIKKT